jgi:Flp pilus assembly protein TadG
MLSVFRKSEDGNVAIMFAAVVVLLGLGLAVAVDGNKMVSVKSKAVSIADSAALAGAAASETDFDNRLAIVQAYIEANTFKLGADVLKGEPIITFDDENEIVTVEIPTTVNLAFGGFVGSKTKPVSAVSTATYLKNNIDPVSIAFALDVSGSMDDTTSNGQRKIDVLKTATRSLFDAIESGTDQPQKLQDVLRSGMSAYNTDLVDTQEMQYGWNHLENSVQQLVADGGTNSTPALENSHTLLLNDRAFRNANEAGFEIDRLQEYVIFMTDGDNNQPEFDEDSYQLCLDMRADGIEIYSVAFEAPAKGELLLVDCASPNVEEQVLAANPNLRTDTCMNNGANGNGLALGHCGAEDKGVKGQHFFDAANATEFEAAFKLIGTKIVKSNVRLGG